MEKKDVLDQPITPDCYIAYASFDAEIRSAQLKIGKVIGISPDGHFKVRRMDEKSARAGTLMHPDRCVVISGDKIPEWMFRES
jgi:hypothetical protein